MSDGNGELPEGWKVAAVEDFARTATGGTPSRKRAEYYGGDIPWVKSGDLNDSVVLSVGESITQLGLDSSNAKMFPKGAVCIALYGATVGKLGILDIDATTNQAVCGIFPENGVDPKYVFNALRNERVNLIAQAQGGAQPNISNGIVKKTQIRLAPKAEQRRIVSAIESLKARSSSARNALSDVGPLLAQFRQSVLRAAFSGRLTADWRATNPDVEPATELLARIRTERRHRWEQSELAKYEAKGKQPPKNWQDKYKEPGPVDESELRRLPDGWCWATVGDISIGDIQTGPFGAQLHRSDFITEGVPVVAIGNVKWGYLDLAKMDYVTEEKAEQLKRYTLREGDVLFTRSGTVGRSAVLPASLDGCRMTGHILRIRVQPEHYLSQLLFRAFQGEPSMDKQLQDRIRGMTRAGFNTTLLSELAIPLPPLLEQAEILGELDKFDAMINETGSAIASSEAELTQLDQSILAKAFRGELVPQDPRDEPASELLARIRAARERLEAEKAAAKKKSKPNKKTSKRSKKTGTT